MMIRWILALMLSAHAVVASAGALAIKKVYESSPGHITLILEVEKMGEVKCALYDAEDNPLRVENSWVSPPLDSFIIATRNEPTAVTSARCWEIER